MTLDLCSSLDLSEASWTTLPQLLVACGIRSCSSPVSFTLEHWVPLVFNQVLTSLATSNVFCFYDVSSEPPYFYLSMYR